MSEHELVHLFGGKVRDLYDAGQGRLLMVASDRISAFDVVMNEPVPGKGRALTAMSAFWFDHLADVAPSHLLSTDPQDFPDSARRADFAGRSMLCRRADMLPIECIVRGYLSGSAWREYQANGTVHGQKLAAGLRESDRFPEPVFTPSTKAESGHDENISYAAAAELVGSDVAGRAREISLELYRRGAAWAADRGLLVADTKFELGLVDGELVVADEVLTPDSSRFWPADGWEPGTTPVSFDKEPLRRWLDTLDWDKQPPPPPLPGEVVAATAGRYRVAYERLSGLSLDTWPGSDDPEETRL